MTKSLGILMVLVLLLLGGCSKPTSYYTNPNSAGYNQQSLGAICEHCGKMMKISGNQLQNVPSIKCPYCSNYSDTRTAAARWVPVKNQREQQASEQVMLGVLKGVTAGLEGYNNGRNSQSATTTYSSSDCLSDYGCGFGKKCVKEQYKSRGVCMKSVDEYGIQTYNAPSGDSVGVNLDEHCSFDTDCPFGFMCDSKYKTCLKR